MELKIYDKQGIVKMTVSPDNSSQWNHEVGVENVVTVNFTTWEFLVLEVGWYILVEGQRFSIKSEYRPKHIHDTKYTYNLKFYGREHDTQDILFCRLNQGEDDLESVFAYDGTPMDFLQKVVANMNRNTDGVVWKAGEAISANRQTINFNGLYCWDALGEIARAFGTEWWMDGEYLNISKCERGESVSLGYGQGLKSGLTQNENTNAVKWFTRLIPVGSSKNIDKSKYGYTTLQLPGREKYIDINTKYGLKEYREEAAFSEIYPHRVGTISSVRSEERTNEETGNYTVYYVKDSSLPFNPDEYMIGGEVIHMTFNSGALAGKDFEVNWNNETKEFEIINQYPDENTQLPGNYLIPAIGDAYVLSNISMPWNYNQAAEIAFEEAVEAYLSEYAKDVSIYSGNTDYIYVAKNDVPLLLGQRVRLISEVYFGNDGRESRITRVSRKLNNLGEASIDCSDAIASSWKSSVDSSLNQLQFAAVNKEAQSLIQILKTGDSNLPSDYNVFSALRSLNTFLRKDKEDTARKEITFAEGLRTLEAVWSFLAGKGTLIKDGVIQTDRIEVRQSMTVMDLIINQLQGIAADYLFSDVAKVDSVTEIADRTYVLHIEKKTDFDFTTLGHGDILHMIVNDLYKGGGNYFSSWMRVLSVDTDANEVTVVQYDDDQVQGGANFAPVAGYNVARRGNVNVPDEDETNERANYWMLSSREGRIQFLQNMFKPTIEDYNYALTLGKLPDIKAIRHLPVTPNKDVGLVAQTAIVENLYQFDYNGDIVPKIVDRGNWSLAVAQSESPYRFFDYEREYPDGDTTYTVLEQHSVWHNGMRFRCLKDKTTEEPKWNSTDWAMMDEYELEMRFTSSEGNAFHAGKVDTEITPSVYLGNIDISDDIAVIDWIWTYELGEYNGRVLHLTNELMPPNWSRANKAKFTCTAYVRKGEDDVTPVSNVVTI